MFSEQNHTKSQRELQKMAKMRPKFKSNSVSTKIVQKMTLK